MPKIPPGREFITFPLGQCFNIVPENTTTPADARINLVMSAGAFGSGEHETSASCMEELERLAPLQGKDVLDLGSGTGILAIAALKLGAESALCVDIEPKAVGACAYNCELNLVQDRVRHCCGTAADIGAEKFELIVANIYGDILIDIADELLGHASPGAIILLSGILYEYNFDVRQRYERLGCKVIKNRMLSEFSTVLLQSP
ncbi:MAG: 50S ribosomal protein L11 methyltransferase [Geobacteraceae bacterium]|nr:50S ribosomal protein L11 methyltransferase [Geobacteraceae bacterium]